MEEGKIRVDISSVEFKDILNVYHGEVVTPDEFDEVFEFTKELLRFFEETIVLGAVIDRHHNEVHFICSGRAGEFTTLFIATAKILIKT
jgi:hypothetical protein